MGFLVLIMMIVSEIGLVVFTCLKQNEKKEWLRNRVIVDAGEIVLFLLMCILPGIDMSFRFMGLLVVLVLRLIISGAFFICKKAKASVEQKIARSVVSMVMGILILGLSLVPAFIFTGYEGKETTGEYKVAEVSAILVDSDRVETFETDGSNREVPVHFYYPEDADASKTYPLVIFSHGAFGYYQSNTSTYMELASNGYVVISLDHPYHSFFTTDTDGKTIIVNTEFLNEVMYINGDSASEEEIFELSSKWLAIRNGDYNFVLDTVEEAVKDEKLSDAWFLGTTEENSILNVLSMIDCDKIGVMGHSLGGASSVSIGRTRDDIDAVIDLDGTMLGEEIGFENGQYLFYEEPYPVPVLSIDNEEHHYSGEAAGSYYVNNVVLENAVEGYNTYFVGSAHMNFTDLPLFAPALASMLGTGSIDEEHCIDTMNEIVLQFMNCNLKNKGEFILQESYE